MRLSWEDLQELVELLSSINREFVTKYYDTDEVKDNNLVILQNSYRIHAKDVQEINWEHGNTEVRIEPRYRYLRIKTPDLELVRLIRTACVNRNYADLEISLSVP